MAPISKTSSPRLIALETEDLRLRSRADFVYDSLRDAIWDGRFAHGERIREEEVAHDLGVSRTPVREALQRLQQRGLLVVGPGRGLVVAELSLQQVHQLYEMREILEGSAARFAAQHSTPIEIEMLRQILYELESTADDVLTLVGLNRRLHQAISEAAHNRYLAHTVDTLQDSFALLHSATFRAPNRRRDSDEEHRRIVDAIERRDADAAEAAAREHIRQARRTRFEAPVGGRAGAIANKRIRMPQL
jgi:DNA-binding GntR family transcriptional regulator